MKTSHVKEVISGILGLYFIKENWMNDRNVIIFLEAWIQLVVLDVISVSFSVLLINYTLIFLKNSGKGMVLKILPVFVDMELKNLIVL